jgi:transposase
MPSPQRTSGRPLPPKRRTYTSQVKNEALRRVLESGQPQAEVARQLDVHPGAVRAWVYQERRDRAGRASLGSADTVRVTELEEENRVLRAENEFLKKARAFFATTSTLPIAAD